MRETSCGLSRLCDQYLSNIQVYLPTFIFYCINFVRMESKLNFELFIKHSHRLFASLHGSMQKAYKLVDVVTVEDDIKGYKG